jgi:putative phosphoesterase
VKRGAAPSPHEPRERVGARGPRVRFAEASIRLRDDGGLTLAVIADTHSRPHARSVELVRALAPDAILHAGDIGDPSVLDAFASVAPLVAVRGNIDEHVLADVVSIDVTSAGASVYRICLLHIGVYGAKIRADAARTAHAQKARLLVCGHSHVPFIGKDKGLMVFNPGSIGPRRFTLPIVFGVITIGNGKLGLHHVDCETGERWAP